MQKIKFSRKLTKKQKLAVLLLPYLALIAFGLLVLIYPKHKNELNIDIRPTLRPASKAIVNNQDTKETPNFRERLNENITLAYDQIEDQYKQVTAESRVIYSQYNKGIFIHQMNKQDLPIIQLSEKQTIVYSMSPNKRYIAYSIANHLDNEEIEEGALTILDLQTSIAKPLMHIPQDKTFSGIHMWGDDSSYFYYALRSSSENLHFPDPQTTLFYRYNLNDNSIKYLAKGSDFHKMGHTYISKESSDKRYLYFFSSGHGDPLFLGAWKLDLQTLLVNQIFDSGYKSESYGDYYYIVQEDLPDERILLSYSTNGEKVGYDGYESKYGFLNLNDGKITFLNIPLEGNLNNLDIDILNGKLYVKSILGVMSIYDLKTEKLEDEFDPAVGANYFFSFMKDNKNLILQLNGFWKGNETWVNFDDIKGVFNLETKELSIVKYYKLDSSKSILTII